MMGVIALPKVICNPFHEIMMNPTNTLKGSADNVDAKAFDQ